MAAAYERGPLLAGEALKHRGHFPALRPRESLTGWGAGQRGSCGPIGRGIVRATQVSGCVER
jgi:hypothetical protein